MHTISISFSFVASLMLFIMAIFVIYKDWRDQINRYYLFYNFCAFGILFTMFLTYAFPEYFSLTVLNRMTQMYTALFFASLFAMSLVFPKREKKFPLWMSLLVLTPAIAVGIIAVVTDWNIARAYFDKNGQLVREFRFFYNIYALIVLSYLLAGTINFIRKYIVTKVKVYRLQMRYVFVGASLAIIFASVCSIILPRVFNYSGLYAIGPSIAAFVATLSLFYSVINYSLMDIRSAMHKTVMYGIISMLIFLPMYGILELFDRNVMDLGAVPYSIVASVIALVFILFSISLQPKIDGIFKRKQYEFERIVDDFIRDVEKITGLKDLIIETVDILFNSLFLKKALFIMLDDQSRRYELFYSKSGAGSVIDVQPLERNSSVIRWFVRNQEILILDRIYTEEKTFGDIRDDLLQFFTANEVQLIMPYYHERRLQGLLCLSEKETLVGFHPNEIEKLAYFLQKSNDFISTALSRGKAMKEQLMSRTIQLSSKLLTSSMPQSLPRLNVMKFGAFIVPKYTEGCDYFDFIRPGDQGIGLIVSDISGVGVNSAVYSVLLRSGTMASINEAQSTSIMMQNLNKMLYDYSKGRGGLVTAFYLYYDYKTMRLMFTNAGFPAMEVYRIEKSNFDSLDTEGIPLGYNEQVAYGTGRTTLQKGDLGVLYTKTLINSKNQKGEEFGLLRVRSIISENRMRGAAEIADLINKSFTAFMGLSTPYSDVIVLLFKVL